MPGRSLKNDPEFANRVELLQDFDFEEASQCVRASEDGDWVMSTGTYKVIDLPRLAPTVIENFADMYKASNSCPLPSSSFALVCAPHK